MQQPKVGIIGLGSVGSTIAYSIIQNQVNCELLLFDIDKNLLQGQVLDLQDSTFESNTKISQSNLKDCGQSDIIIVTAGAKQKPNESRDALLKRNETILKSIIDGMENFNPNSIWLVVANPVDRLAYLTQKLTKLPHHQVIGTGTLLDTLRLRAIVADRLNTDPSSINLMVVGEHGDQQIALWSHALVGGLPLLNHPRMITLNEGALDHLSYQAMRRAYNIIENKGCTHFGIGYCVQLLVNAILKDTNKIYPVSCYHPNLGIYLSFPAKVNKDGVSLDQIEDEVQKTLGCNSIEADKLKKLIEVLKKDMP